MRVELGKPKMPFREFTIEGTRTKQVTDRGVRAQIYSLASSSNLRAVALNVRPNVVRVVVKGDEPDIQDFYQQVVKFCTSRLRLSGRRITRLSDYSGVEPDWAGLTSSFMLEQLSKGINYLQSINNQFVDARSRFDRIYISMASVERQVKALPIVAREVRGLRQEITKARKLAERFLEER